MKIRMVPAAADWNNDGLLDVIGAAANGRIELFAGRREAGKWGFAPGAPLKVPGVPYGPTASVVDWNDDGDADLVVSTAYSYTCLFENSFLKHGYREAEKVDWQRR